MVAVLEEGDGGNLAFLYFLKELVVGDLFGKEGR